MLYIFAEREKVGAYIAGKILIASILHRFTCGSVQHCCVTVRA